VSWLLKWSVFFFAFLDCFFLIPAVLFVSLFESIFWLLFVSQPCPFDGHCQTCALDPFERAGVLFVDQIKAHFNVCQHLVFYCRNCSIDLKNLNKAALQELIAKHVLAHQIAQDQVGVRFFVCFRFNL